MVGGAPQFRQSDPNPAPERFRGKLNPEFNPRLAKAGDEVVDTEGGEYTVVGKRDMSVANRGNGSTYIVTLQPKNGGPHVNAVVNVVERIL